MIYLIVFASILLGYGDDVFNSLYDDSNWNLVYTKNNGLSVYNKKIDSIPIKAIKVTYIDTVDIDTFTDTVLQGDRHTEFLEKSHLTKSHIIKQIGDSTLTYQYLDLPVISNRNYISINVLRHIEKGVHHQMNWSFLKNIEDPEIIKNISDDAILMIDGIGGWEIKKIDDIRSLITYRIIADPGGWIPGFLINQSNKILAPNTIEAMVNEAKRRELAK